MATGRKYLPENPGEALRRALFWLAPLACAWLVFFVELDPDNPAVTNTLAVAVLMALWWVTEIVPLAVTSLLPIVLFPALGIMDGRDVSATYFNHVIFLFIGGFLVALAIQKWHLHKRMALRILGVIGSSPGRILLGFMLATAFLSMWISNTATAMLMIPILLSVVVKLEEINGPEKVRHFAVGLLLCVAYSASIGGAATLVGSPPNLSFARIFYIYFPEAPEISFASWFFYAFPISLCLFGLLFAYLYLVFIQGKRDWVGLGKEQLSAAYRKLGPRSYEESVLLAAFVVLAGLWFFRADISLGPWQIPGWANFFNRPAYFNDGTVAILIGILLFVIPSRSQPGTFLMDWETARAIPWGIILLFGGGFALATGFKESGLSMWFGQQLQWLGGVHPLVLLLCISGLVTFLTELTSNTATVETLLPILAGLALQIETNPLLFMLPATVAGSMAFMLPVATPPNAIVFGSKRLTVMQMAKTGFVLNLIGILTVTLFTYYFGTLVFDIVAGEFPDWARGSH